MNKRLLILTLLLVYNAIFCANKQLNPYILTFFIKPLTIQNEKELESQKIKNLNQAKDLQKKFFKIINSSLIKHPEVGIYASYAGYSTYSNHNGQISFSRQTALPKINLLLTQDIKPVFQNPNNPNTILGFVVDPKANFKYYSIERKESVQDQVYNWYISEQPLSLNKIIPYDSIILFLDPKNFFVPLGQTSAIGGENLLLPDIYLIKNPDSVLNVFRFLKVRQYFAPVNLKSEFKEDVYQQRVAN
ncbi:hypothetical protein [Candidatus Babela massiliensis]|uniref:Uncharacterized protein n=1 Tax=Candidatus Babela massiliensis TaxID=673862 RepID=V6DFQ2_9BACT|nr:hypothetical protein [Candidatus Babela massiliensis]CDK30400.1 hypothetical protein BABL1_gene_665 [Candidatus Babela massiliensis]